MLTKEEIYKWLSAYDSRKYPTSVYDELVIQGTPNKDRIKLLGAWKTGCLRKNREGNAYQDKDGGRYEFTKRWGPTKPVGYNIWIKLSEKEDIIRKAIPTEFPQSKPKIVSDLEARKGFGFIWAVFVLHCFYPDTYPLYDQHVCRAHRNIGSTKLNYVFHRMNDWNTYAKYRNFFKEQMRSVGLPFWVIDRALWAYGKHLKEIECSMVEVKRQELIDQIKPPQEIHSMNGAWDFRGGWIHGKTMGGRKKSFWWKVDDRGNLSIARVFITQNSRMDVVKLITKAELTELNSYIPTDRWIPLANNVQKLSDGTEKEGIGKYMYEKFGWPVIDCQLAGHLGVIFFLAGVWRYNGKQRGIGFMRKPNAGYQNIVNYYKKLVSEKAE